MGDAWPGPDPPAIMSVPVPYIVVHDGGTRKVYPLVKDIVNVGRSSKSDVRINHTSISRMHCRFIRTEEGFKIKDLGSRNGTYVNWTRVDEELLQDGDEVGIGEIQLTFLKDKPPGGTTSEVTQPLSIYDERTGLLLQTILASIQLREMDRFLPVVVDNVIKLAGAERGMILFRKPEAPEGFEVRLARDNLGITIEDVSDFSRKIPRKVLEEGKPIYIRDLREETARVLYSSAFKYNLLSIMCVPLKIGNRVFGALYVDSHTAVKEFSSEDHLLLQAVANHLALAIENVRLYEEQMIEELNRRQALERENLELRRKIESRRQIVGECPAMKAVYEIVRKAAPTDATVLIQGDSGTGKEAIAHLLHDLSPRSEKPFVVVDCAAIPETLLESELFGYEKGAFTGASSRKIGKFELAQGGTVFLDEIGELPISLQAKILRALQEKEVHRVGGVEPVPVDVRVIAASNRNLKEMVEAGKFRQDLYYRLNVVTLQVPPLRERGSDILLLAEHFLEVSNERYGKSVEGFDVEAREALQRYNWPGNVRELKHRIERAVILTNNDKLTAADLELDVAARVRTLEEARDRFEKQYIYNALLANRHNVTRTAGALGISRQHLQNLIKKHNL